MREKSLSVIFSSCIVLLRPFFVQTPCGAQSETVVAVSVDRPDRPHCSGKYD